MRNLFFFGVFLLVLGFASCGKSGKLRGCVKVDGKYGYVDETGSFVIDPAYTNAWSYINGSAVVKKDNKYGLIDVDGREIVAPRWDSVIPFSVQCFITGSNGRFGFAAHGTGKEIIPAQYEQVYYYTADLCVVQKGRALGVVNAAGELVCPFVLQDLREMTGPLGLVVKQDTSNAEDMLLALLQGGENKRFGLINTKGKLVLEPEYNEIFTSESGSWYYPFLQDSSQKKIEPAHSEEEFAFDEHHPDAMIGTYGIVDSSGKLIAQPVYDQQPVYGDGMFRISRNGKYGFIDAQGKEVVAPVYAYATPFRNGCAAVTANGKNIIIDKTGNTIGTISVPASEVFKASCERIRFRAPDGRYGYCDKSGRVVVEPQFEAADDFVFNRAIVEQNGRYGLIDRNGKWVSEPQWLIIYSLGDGFFHVKELSKDAASDSLAKSIGYLRNIANSRGAGGVIDTNGRSILPVVFDEIYHLQPGYFTVEAAGYTGCYKTNGQLVYKPLSLSYIYFYQGRTVVKEDNGSGIIDETGRYIVAPQYDSIGLMFNGYAVMSRGGRFGLIDSTGNVVIAPSYDEVQPLVNGTAVFKQKGKFGYLTVAGKELFAARFDEASPLINPMRKTLD
ncbi:MAG: WG repeat-containing protein [Bacteroidetes bacterium]|nr:WG repeat-containing protein [Bacteroidota bacterium]